VLAHREQFHQSRLVEHAIPSSVQYQDRLHQVTNYFVAHGSSFIQAQASFLGYVDAFWVLMVISLAALLLAMTLRNVKLGGPAPSIH
jgi:DHA2 family multidrug resistance protein